MAVAPRRSAPSILSVCCRKSLPFAAEALTTLPSLKVRQMSSTSLPEMMPGYVNLIVPFADFSIGPVTTSPSCMFSFPLHFIHFLPLTLNVRAFLSPTTCILSVWFRKSQIFCCFCWIFFHSATGSSLSRRQLLYTKSSYSWRAIDASCASALIGYGMQLHLNLPSAMRLKKVSMISFLEDDLIRIFSGSMVERPLGFGSQNMPMLTSMFSAMNFCIGETNLS